MNKKLRSLKNDESGMVAIMMTMFLIIIMSLIVLSMSQNSNKEQRQALDRQLSDQAFYNAETGINDTAWYLYNNPSAPIDNLTSDCQSLGVGAPSRDIDGAAGVNKYTCVLYNKAPAEAYYDSLSTSNPKVLLLQAVNNAGGAETISKLTISWDDTENPSASVSSPCNFSGASPDLPTTCGYGGVRIDLIRPTESRDLLRQLSFITYLLPSSSGSGAVNYSNDQGSIALGSCPAYVSGTRRCKVTINDVNGNNLFLTLRSLYRPTNVTVSAVNPAGNTVRFKDSQIMIDSTGRSADVLRRIQVRIPARSEYSVPGFTLQTKDSICKVLNVRRDSASSGTVTSDDATNCPIN